jgi:hypothetical protein
MTSRNLQHLHAAVREAFLSAKLEWEEKNKEYVVNPSCTYRSPDEQLRLFKQGREQQPDGSWKLVDPKQWKTDKDGYKNKSLHNYMPSLAVDVFFVRRDNPRVADWSAELFNSFAEVMKSKSSGISWGGDWKRKDRPHFQLS